MSQSSTSPTPCMPCIGALANERWCMQTLLADDSLQMLAMACYPDFDEPEFTCKVAATAAFVHPMADKLHIPSNFEFVLVKTRLGPRSCEMCAMDF
eukprot:1190405-Amphidinium_carterae.1